MTYAQKCKLISYSILGAISILEVGMLCHLVHAGLNTPFTLISIVGFVALFNSSVWYFRHKYDSARYYYEKKDKEENDT